MTHPDVGHAPGDTEALHLAVLGSPLVHWGQRVVVFRSRKELALLIYLAMTRTPQPREHLADLLWPDHDEAMARNSLRTTLSRLRLHLAEAGGTTVAALPLLRTEQSVLGREVVELTGAGAASGSPTIWCDLDMLAAVASPVGEVVVAGGGAEEAQLEAAASLYRGPFLAGLLIDNAPEWQTWMDEQRTYWQRQVERVLGRMATLQLGRHALPEASTTARRWLALNALSEPAYRVLMRALSGAGDRAGALAAYEECRDVLQAQLAVDPAPETVALAARLRRLPLSVSAPPAGEVGGAGPVPLSVDLPFVGREQEFAALVAAYRAARTGQLQVVVLTGEAGSGKSRLAEEFLRWAALEGGDVLHSRGEEAPRGAGPFQLLVDALRPRLAREHAPDDLVADVWLTELVRLFPELRERYPDLPLPTALAGDEEAGPTRLLEALSQFVLALAEQARPEALVLSHDDVQWADPAMRDLLLSRLRRHAEAGAPHLLLLTVPTEALARVPELEQWLIGLSRQAPTTRLTLGPLAEEETAQALAALLVEPTATSGKEGPRLGTWLYDQSEGQPFYLVELLRALVGEGLLAPSDQVQDGAAPAGPRLALASGVEQLPHLVPAGVQDLIRGQLGGLSMPAVEVLAAAAVLGAEATFERLCRVAEVDERSGLAALDELSRRGLLVEAASEQGEGGGPVAWRFAHQLVREVVYNEAGEARRRLFHQRARAVLAGSAQSAALAVAADDAETHDQQARRLLAGSDTADLRRRQDWGEAPAVPVLRGRAEELATLAGWVRDERCRVVQVLGTGGIGKTSLVARLAHGLAAEFEIVYWRSLRNALPPEEWLDGAIAALAVGQVAAPAGLEAQLRLLLDLLRTRRALLVLDNLETVLEPGTRVLRYRAEYEGYAEALRQLSTSPHRGCLLLTSREQPLREDEPAVRALHLAGLGVADGRALLGRRPLAGDEAAWRGLVTRYGGNPLALQVVGETIEAVFGGDIADFLTQEASVFGSVRQLVDEQVARLSPLEQAVLIWLAVEREPVTFADLVADLGPGVRRGALVEAVQALRRRSLLEWGVGGAFTLQPVVLELATERLVEDVEQEVLAGQPVLLIRHALIKAPVWDYVRRSQERLVARPLLERLSSGHGGASVVERRLLDLLDAWRGRPPEEQGYGPGNVVNLLRLLRGEVRGLDFSRLTLRHAYLADLEAQDASLVEAHLAETVLAEAFADPMSVALSADGTLLAAGTNAGEVCLWRVADRTLLLTAQGHSGPIFGMALSADGQLMASGGFDGAVKLWAAPSGRLLATLQGHTGEVFGVALSADGHLVASGSFDGTVKLWAAPSGRLLATLQGRPSPHLGVALSGDGRLVASGSFDGTVQLWDVSSGRLLIAVQEHKGGSQSVVLSADGRLLASSGFDGTITLREAAQPAAAGVPSGESQEPRSGMGGDSGSAEPSEVPLPAPGQLLATVQAHGSQVWSLALSQNGGLLASGSFDGSVKLWEAPSGRLLTTLQGHTGGVWSLALSGDGGLLASGSVDGAIKLWEAPSGRLLATLQGHSSGVWGVALSRDGELVAGASMDGRVRVWEAESGRLLPTAQGPGGPILSVALSRDRRLMASASMDGRVRVWEAESGRLLATLQGHTSGIWGVALSGDGGLLASGSSDGTVRLWDVPGGRLLATLLGHSGPVMNVALSEDGDLVASCSLDRTVRLWEVAGGRPLATLEGHAGGVWGVALSEDGRLVTSGSVDGSVKLWEAPSGLLLATLQGHTGAVRSVALSGDGGLLASGSSDGTVRLWGVPGRQLVATLEGHAGGVWGVALSEDGRLVACGGLDGAVRLWETRSGACLRLLRQDRRYERLDITGLTGVTEAQRAALLALGAVQRGA